MTINVFPEPSYENTIWAKQTLRGIADRVSKLRYSLRILSEDELKSFSGRLIIVGSTPSWFEEICRKYPDVTPVAVSCGSDNVPRAGSLVRIDYEKAARQCIAYMKNCGRERVALFGVSGSSFADRLKSAAFPEEDVFDTSSGIENAFSAFLTRHTEYGGVLCANCVVGVYLEKRLRDAGIDVPSSLYVCTFGDSVIGSLCVPPLTALSLDHYSLGSQSVALFAYLEKQEQDVSVTVKVPCVLRIAESTENRYAALPSSPSVETGKNAGSEAVNAFYREKELHSILSLEKALSASEGCDTDILQRVLSGKSYAAIAEELFISENTVKYRLRRLLRVGGFESLGELTGLYGEYLGL